MASTEQSQQKFAEVSERIMRDAGLVPYGSSYKADGVSIHLYWQQPDIAPIGLVVVSASRNELGSTPNIEDLAEQRARSAIAAYKEGRRKEITLVATDRANVSR